MPEENFDLFAGIGSEDAPSTSSREQARKEIEGFSGELPVTDPYNNTYAKTDYDNDRWKEHIAELKQIRELKERFSKYILKYLAAFSFFCLFIIVMQGLNPKFDFSIQCNGARILRARMGQFHLDNTPLTTLIGSTAVSAIGLVAIVLKGLFKSPDDNKDKDKDKD